MRIKKVALALLPIALSTTCAIAAPHRDHDIPRIDHAFVILMENHYYGQIIGDGNAPFINSYAKSANLATNYYAVGHPSLTNYLEIAGGLELRRHQRRCARLAQYLVHTEYRERHSCR